MILCLFDRNIFENILQQFNTPRFTDCENFEAVFKTKNKDNNNLIILLKTYLQKNDLNLNAKTFEQGDLLLS